jgi:ketosteroid isomerase-like protein
MKKMIITSCLCFCGYFLFAQDKAAIEAEIRSLEQNEVQAVLNKDTVTLKKLWDKDYVVNNPENKIILAKTNSVDRPVLQKQKTSFTREVEKIIINGDVAISMGREVVVSMDDTPKVEQTVERRYTNIWMKKDDSWKLIARHANKICQKN